MPYYERRIKSGTYLEVERYFATRDGKKYPRDNVIAESADDQNRYNARQSQRRLMRLIHTNYDGRNGDLFITYTHRDNITEAEAMKARRKLLDALRRIRKRKGLDPLKYIIITEKQGKWHHHIIINGGLSMEELNEVWKGQGRVSASTLDDTNNYADLSKYLIKAEKPPKRNPTMPSIKEKRKKYARRWSTSRNLKQPEVTKRVIKPLTIHAIPKAPKGYRLLPDWIKGADRSGNYYLYFTCVVVGEAPRPKARCNDDMGLGRSPNGVRGSAPPSELGTVKQGEG